MRNVRLKKLALCGLLSTLSLITFLIENLFPPLIIPGAKIGLSNVFILLSALVLGAGYGYATLVIKVLLGSLFSGNISAIVFSLPSGAIALTLEIIAIYFIKRSSIVSISVLGAVVNITTQNLIFCLYTQTPQYLVYLPYLALIGILGGVVTGFAVYIISKRLPKKILI
ncbi:MAG: Gx transporter family protein [Clostridia bacterium]|nr:Gx transporter family protein [Clostridia bacterium]